MLFKKVGAKNRNQIAILADRPAATIKSDVPSATDFKTVTATS
jgi:hypothetical protein